MTSTSTGKRVDEAILKLAEWLNLNTGVQDHTSAIQESTNPCLAFCQWMGLEACKLSEDLLTGFMCDSFNMVECYMQLQAHAAGTSSSSSCSACIASSSAATAAAVKFLAPLVHLQWCHLASASR